MDGKPLRWGTNQMEYVASLWAIEIKSEFDIGVSLQANSFDHNGQVNQQDYAGKQTKHDCCEHRDRPRFDLQLVKFVGNVTLQDIDEIKHQWRCASKLTVIEP